MVILKFRLTREEYFTFNYYTAWSAPSRKNYRVRYYVRMLLIYGLIAGLYIFAKYSGRLIIDLIIFLGVGAFYVFLIPFLIKRSVRRRAEDILAEKENAHILDDAEVILSENGIVDKDKVSESRYAWDAIVRKADTPDSYYLYTNTYHAIVIPKRVLTNATERSELEELFTRYLPLSSEFGVKDQGI
jgi:hypothetical protein